MQPSKKSKTSFKLSTEEISYLAFSLLAGIIIGAWFILIYSNVKSLIFQAIITVVLSYVLLKHGWQNVAVFISTILLSLLLFYILSKRNCDTNQITGLVIEKRNNYFIILGNNFRRYYVKDKGCDKCLYEIYRLNGYSRIYETMFYEGKDSFSQILNRRGVYYEFVPKETITIHKRFINVDGHKAKYLSFYPKTTQNLINSLVFGNINYKDDLFIKCIEIKALYFLRSSGLTYKLVKKQKDSAINYLSLNKKISKKISKGFDVLFLLLFWKIIGVKRIFVKDLFNDLNKKNGYKYPPVFSTTLSGLLLILLNIYNVYNIGFLIGLGMSFYFSLGKRFIFKQNKLNNSLNCYLTVFLLLFPFHISGGYFPLILPIYTLIFPYLTLPFILLNYVSFLTFPFTNIINGYSDFLRNVFYFIHEININVPVLGNYDFSHILIYYALIIFCSYLLDSGFRVKRKYLVCGLCAFMCLKSIPVKTYVSSEVTFLNIGQGDCIVIRDRKNVVMIDTGGNIFFDMAKEVDIPYLRKNSINHIDYLIASHADYDHVGAVSSLTKNFPVYNFCYKPSDFPLSVGNLRFKNLNKYKGEDENANSLVLYLEFLGQRWLFTGDATKEIENQIISDNPDLRVDILKLGHHGSNTSSAEKFLKAVKPKIAIISCGKNNLYKHPSKEVIDRLNALKIPYLRTDELGTITYKSYFNMPIYSTRKYKHTVLEA